MTQRLALIPYPVHVEERDGTFTVPPGIHIHAAASAEKAARLLAHNLHTPAASFEQAMEPPAQGTITFALNSQLADEGYTLDISPAGIVARASSERGFIYAAHTLLQIFPPHTESDVLPNTGWMLHSVHIEDAPRFRWRGLHLDVGRHMFPVAFIKRFIALMAQYKYNVFHWHLTEDQGWRIEIKQYPKLTEIGAWRSASPVLGDRTRLDGKPYGGYYTQDEVREVVKFAADYGITVVPEIEMPGHAVAALAAYPEYGCVGHGYQPRTFWGIEDDVFCAGNENTYTFVQNILDEVLALFPSEYIHIGGDECPKVRWEHCPKCQAKIKAEGLKDEHELQSYFIRRMEAYLDSKGRRLIGWDEILEGGLPPKATVMSWRGTEGGIAAASEGHDVVMSPTTYVYLDYYQSEDTDGEPPAIGGYLPLEHVYAFDPVEGVPDDKLAHVLGGQGNVWTEYMPTEAQVEYMTYPRALALAEAVWSPPENRTYDEFRQRLSAHLPHLDKQHVNFRKLD